MRCRYSPKEDAGTTCSTSDVFSYLATFYLADREKFRASSSGGRDGLCAYVHKHILPNRNRGSINYRVRLLKSRMNSFSSKVVIAARTGTTNESKPAKIPRTKRTADWTPELSKQLIEAVEMYGPKWAIISNDEPFKGFRTDFLYEAYWVSMANAKLFDMDADADTDTKLYKRKKRGVKAVWTKEMDELLLNRMMKLGIQRRNPWVQLAQMKEFEQFTPKQIFAHWHEVVDPYRATSKDPGGRGVEASSNAPRSYAYAASVWTQEEDAILLKAFEEYRKHMPTNNIEGPTRINLSNVVGPSAVRFSLIRAYHPELAKFSSGQISQRITRLYQAQVKTIPWTPEEDERILQFKALYPVKTPWRLFYQLQGEKETYKTQANLPVLGDISSDHGVIATIRPPSQVTGVTSNPMLAHGESESINAVNGPIWRCPSSLYKRAHQLVRRKFKYGKFSEEENAVLVKMFRELNGNLFSLDSRDNKDANGNTIDLYDFLASDKFVTITWNEIALALDRDSRSVRQAAHKIWGATVGAKDTNAATAISPVLKIPVHLLCNHVRRQSVSLPFWNQTADTLLMPSVTKILQNTILVKDANETWQLQYTPPLAEGKSTVWPLATPFLDHVKSLENKSSRGVLLCDGMNADELVRETEAAVQKGVTKAYERAGLAEGTDFWSNLQQGDRLKSQKKRDVITVDDISPATGGISKKRVEALMEHHHLVATHVILWDLVALELNGNLKDMWFQNRDYSCQPVGDDYRVPEPVKVEGKTSGQKKLLNLQFLPKRVERRWRVLRKELIWNTSEW
ncbi:hypothetical protein HDU81_004114 [Chytriomyces hyalinus]|nr:hypothetical protein HDU81_004114 [Chytriomyces hyalinus]